ncbi:MAG: GGDEF domain-containing protein [Lachnospiraceae bacterium]|nr:GGDEF domain-containing protein [Lachnospiraceae bacterium]
MDSSAYDAKTAELIDQCTALMKTLDPAVLKLFPRIRKRAGELEDNALMGFACYYESYMIYYMGTDYHTFRPSLTKSVRYLLRSGDYEMLAGVYNFVAVDAHNNGNYDVAYNYYMTGKRFADAAERTGMSSVMIEINLGRLYLELGKARIAKKHNNRALRDIRALKDHFRYRRTLLAVLLNGTTIELALGDKKKARQMMERAEKEHEKADTTVLQDIAHAEMFLRIRLLLADGKEAEAKKQLRAFIKDIRVEEQVHEYIEDIGYFIRALTDFRLYKEAASFIRAIDGQIRDTDITHVMRVFCEAKVYYYNAAGDEKKLLQSLIEQHELLERQRQEQNSTYRYSIELIDAARELGEEQDILRHENELLQMQARTDALTGLPNRYSMVKELEEAFERAYQGRTTLGVEILDIDSFKEYNDSYGHRAGDKCLEKIAKVLLKAQEKYGTFCARYGGDEFVVVYEGCDDDEILKRAEQLDRAVRALRIRHGENRPQQIVTVSQGICNDIPMEKNKLWDFLSEADQALYTIKKSRDGQGKHLSVCLKKRPETFIR